MYGIASGFSWKFGLEGLNTTKALCALVVFFLLRGTECCSVLQANDGNITFCDQGALAEKTFFAQGGLGGANPKP